MSDITQQSWMLVEYDDGRGGLVPVLEGTMATLRLTAGRAWGSAGCNRYAGPCEISESEISVGPLLHTKLMCSESVMEQEAHFLALLQFVNRFRVSAGRLDLRWDSRSGLVLAPVSDLHGSWSLSGYQDDTQDMVTVASGAEITATFDDGGRLSGSGGCNRYTAHFEVVADSINISAPVITRMLCEQRPDLMELEARYLRLLTRTKRFRAYDGRNLEFCDGDGSLLLKYHQAVVPFPTPGEWLGGTTWRAEDVAGRGALDYVMPTLSFDQGGTVSGDTGPNRFVGSYRFDAGKLRIGQLTTTRRTGPDAVMDQERRFLTILSRPLKLRNDPPFLLLDDGQATTRLIQLSDEEFAPK